MHANLIARIRRIFSRFVMKLVKVVPSGPNQATANVPNESPIYVLGASSTAAGEMAKTDERSNFPNIYPGTLPTDDSRGTFTDATGDTYANDPLTATKPLLESFWEFYQSTAPDPTDGRSDDLWGDTIGDYGHSGQSSDGNLDGDTKFYTNSSAGPN